MHHRAAICSNTFASFSLKLSTNLLLHQVTTRPFRHICFAMAPAPVSIDLVDDFSPTVAEAPRTLLLAPPSLAAHSAALTSILSQHDRSVTDLQMLDRLSAGLVSLPTSTYGLVLVLADASAALAESQALLNRTVLGPVAEALRPKGRLQSQIGTALDDSALEKEAVLAGLVRSNGGFEKPDYGDGGGVVTLKLGRKKEKSDAGPPARTVAVNTNGHVGKVDMKPAAPAGVRFVDSSNDLDCDDDDDDDDDLIDEDTLMTEEDLKRPINIRKSAPYFAPNTSIRDP